MGERMLTRAIAVLIAIAIAPVTAVAAEKVAFFGILLVNTSPEALSDVEEDRRVAMEERLVSALRDSERYVFVDTSPVAEKADLYSNLAHCNGCDARMAEELGADIALTGEVQKTSNLILSISIYMREAGTGRLIGGGSADIRGNTDRNWERGITYVIKNRILK